MNLEQLIDQFDLVTSTDEGLDQLRKLILNLAVRGELTKRKNFEIDASRLVEDAIEEKQELYEDGEIRKPKEFDDVTSDEVSFEIPEDWEWCRLCDISIIETGKRMKGGARDEGVISLGGEHLNPDGTIDYSIPRCITEEFYDQLNRGQIEVGDILIVKDGATTGKTAFVRKLPESGKAAINEHVVLVRALSTVDKNFLFRFIQILSEEFAKKHSKGVIGGVKMSQLRSFPVPLPTLEEQQRIVQKIETLFSQVDELEQKVQQDREVDERLQVAVLDDLQRAETPEASRKSWQRLTDHFEQIYQKPEHIDQLKQAILNEAVRGRLVPQDPNDEPAEKLLESIKEEKQRLYEEGEIRKPKDLPNITDNEIRYELPRGWTWCKYDKVCTIETNLVDPKNHLDKPHIAPNYIEKSSGRLLEYNTIKEDGVKSKKHIFRENRIIYSKIRPRLSKLIISDFVGLCSADMYPIRTFVDLEYIFYYMLSPVFYSQAISSDTRVAMPKINQSELYAINVPLPPLKEQGRIVNIIKELYSWCDDLKEKLSRSQQTDQRLLEALVNGHE